MGGYIICLFSALDNRAKMSSDTDESETTVVMDDPTCSEPKESDSSSEDSVEAAESNFRKMRRLSRYENYVHGTAREYISFVARPGDCYGFVPNH